MTSPVDKDVLARKALEENGLSKSFGANYRSEVFVVLIVFSAICGMIGQCFKAGGPDVPSILLAIPATLAFVITYLQWRAGRHEASYEKYFERIKDVNALFSIYRVEKIKDCTSVSDASLSHLQTMFNFSELDLIEYILGKLRLGYVRQELAERALRVFIARCMEDLDGFHSHMEYWVGVDAKTRNGGYEESTCQVVRFILSRTKPDLPASSSPLRP